MRKTLNVVLAVVLALAMVGGMSYVVTPERTSEYQISLVSAKAVTIQDSTQGVRSYSDLVDTTKGFQVNEVINVAITAEVKNLEKPSTNNKYKSISGKDVKVIVGSPNIDFSVARLSSPTLLTHVWSGYTGLNVATVGYVMHAGEVLKYDKAANEISWTFRGRDQYAMTSSTSVGYNLVTFDPQLDDGKIVIPAIKLKDRTDNWTLGSWSYDTTYEAPESIAYTMVLTGVTMDNAGAATGEFYAKIQVSAAEKFQDEDKYYVDYNGKAYDDVPTATQLTSLRTGQSTPLEWLDYVEIDVDKLEIAGGYNVYRYDIPASAILVDIPIIYGGDYDDFNGTDSNNTSWVDGEIIARVQPQTWDFATTKDDKTTVDVAGGVKSMKAYDYYQDGSKATTTLWTSKSDYPVTSVVYSADKAYYAPGFYGGKTTFGRSGPDEYYSSEPTTGTPIYGSVANTSTVTVVDYYYVDLPKAAVAGDNFLNTIQVWKADQLTLSASVASLTGTGVSTHGTIRGFMAGSSIDPATFAGAYTNPTEGYPTPYVVPQDSTVTVDVDRLSEKVEYTSEWIEANGMARVIVRPISTAASHTYPLTGDGGTLGNQWVVFYYDPADASSIVVPFAAVANLNHSTRTYRDDNLKQGDAFLAPQMLESAYATPGSASGIAAPMLTDDRGSALQFLGATAANSVNTGYDNAFSGASLGTYGAATYTAHLNFLKNYAANNMLSWPVFTEVYKEIPISLSSNNKPVVSYGELYDATTTNLSTPALFPLEYNSQVEDIYFYDTLTDATLKNESTRVSYEPNWTAATAAAGVYGDIVFTSYEVVVKDGKSYIEMGGAYIYTATTTTGTGWEAATSLNQLWFSQLIVVSMNKGNVDDQYSYDGSYAAPVSMWDISANDKTSWHIKYHNGIVVYTITANSTDRPWISMATENTEFDSDDGYGIALFDGYNANELAHRIYRSNDSNLSYSDSSVGGHVEESASMIAAQKYFGLDTSYGTTFQVKDDAFETKGAAAVYSENVTGTFKYGDLVIIGETVEESTEEVEVVEDDVEEDFVEPEEDFGEDEEIPEDVEPEEQAPVTSAPRTGDSSANVAIALAAAAIVAAAGLAFVMKKVR